MVTFFPLMAARRRGVWSYEAFTSLLVPRACFGFPTPTALHSRQITIDPIRPHLDCLRGAIMGIKQLFQIIKEEAPEAIKEGEIKNHFGRKVAIVCLASHQPVYKYY